MEAIHFSLLLSGWRWYLEGNSFSFLLPGLDDIPYCFISAARSIFSFTFYIFLIPYFYLFRRENLLSLFFLFFRLHLLVCLVFSVLFCLPLSLTLLFFDYTYLYFLNIYINTESSGTFFSGPSTQTPAVPSWKTFSMSVVNYIRFPLRGEFTM